MHVMEQSPWEMHSNLRRAGFKSRVFVRQQEGPADSVYGRLYHRMQTAPGLR